MRVRGRFEVSERYGAQLTVQSLAAAQDGEYELTDLIDAPAASVDQMEADLRQLIETVRNPHLRRLLDALFGEHSEVWQRFRSAPAAKFYHQAYVHGLLEHTLSVGQAVSAVSASFPGVDRDLAVTGALIHDIGKIEAYAQRPVRDRPHRRRQAARRDPARLLPGAPQIERIDGFPPDLARALLHILLSHHGTARERQPRDALHARGDGRARDRQPRRQARLASTGSRRASRTASPGRASTARCRGSAWFARGRGQADEPLDSRSPPPPASSPAGWAPRPRRSSDPPGGPMEGTGEDRPFLRMSNARDHKLGIFMVALLAAASVRLDDIWYRRPMDAQLWPDWLIAVILAFSASVVLIGTRRLLESRAQITELARRTSAPGRRGLDRQPRRRDASLLGRVAEQACSILHVERATVCVRDRNDPRLSIVVAGHGVRDE